MQKATADYEKSIFREVKTNSKIFFRYASNKRSCSQIISDRKDGKKVITDICEKKPYNMFFTSVFTKKTDTLPDLHNPSDNAIDSTFFTVNKGKSKLK